jgi:hypothetical protein
MPAVFIVRRRASKEDRGRQVFSGWSRERRFHGDLNF